jgi:hypothetical protein
MASPVKVDGSQDAPVPNAPLLVSCRHGTRWVVEVATGRVVREPCARCEPSDGSGRGDAPTKERAGR